MASGAYKNVLFAMDINTLTDQQLATLVENRWNSSDTVWDIVKKTYDKNSRVYKNDPEWADSGAATRKRAKIRANRIFRDTESVINALIANLPQPNIIPSSDQEASKKLARAQEKYFLKKYKDRNVKEQIRKGLRNLYLSRLIVLKPFWNAKINDFDARSIDPRKIRVSKSATKEDDTEFVIEEVSDNLSAVAARFPAKKPEILKQYGYDEITEADAYINNPEVTYKEAWVGDWVICKMKDQIISKTKNPYWDWDGLMVTEEEYKSFTALSGDAKVQALLPIKMAQASRAPREMAVDAQNEVTDQGDTTPGAIANDQTDSQFRAYFFNHFDHPRKPYIFATILNYENTPVGQTDFITQATPLQEGIDRRKQDIDENASLVNGQIKVDSSVMSKADAQKLRYEARGVIWGKNVKDGVTREMGTPLPNFVFDDMVDSRTEIDNIMGASSAFRGQREGQETKAGRLALIDQSYLALNELVQVVDYVNYELFNWFYQLAKVRYTEHHYEKELGKDGALEAIELIRDGFEDGVQVRVISGKTLPEDRQFKFEQAQGDVAKGILSPMDYLEVAGYDDPVGKAKNAVKYKLNPSLSVGLTQQEIQEFSPQAPPDMPKLSINYTDLPPDGQVQLAAKAGIQLDPRVLLAEKMVSHQNKQTEINNKAPIPSPIQA